MAGGAAADSSVDHRQSRCAQCDNPASARGLCIACYERHRRRQKAYGRWETTYVDARPVRDHVTALRAAGISNLRLRELTGISHTTVQTLMTGRPARGTGPSAKVSRSTADKLLSVPIPDIAFQAVALRRPVPALGTTRRLQALAANGYSQRDLCRRLGWHWQGNLTELFNGRARQITAVRAREVAALFTELQMIPGTDRQARARALARGWLPPLDWDEDTIDDPTHQPEHTTTPRNLADDLDEFEYLLDAGEHAAAACTRVGATPTAMIKRYERANRLVPPALASAAHTARARREQVAS
ncbi:helix-turn-helix DNA-binding domain protein [Gordonia phage Ruthy]|uniref:Helix-turn-helix DNA-binding domain protein n=1 Tax=Gordonia phage Ruthy TaxID=2250323 RepID=A0A345L5H4_9CAUD|nr:helix-turn-helix DNA binding domain protein [Gordonia phage Ruthy]AXH50526.1 helix-turn-helix DNA-binding domain protein [Gordonia phage Ruthy]